MINTETWKFGSQGKRFLPRAVLFSLLGGAVLAAALFVANNQPWGYIAPPALSGGNFSRGDVVAYTPWFEDGTFQGDLMALPVDSSGAVAVLSPQWRAALVLDSQHFMAGRRIVTTDGSGNGIPFQYADLTPAQAAAVGSAAMLDYVRGDRSNESATGLRVRSSVLGDIVHSNPVYVGKPLAGYTYGGYLAFATDNASRAERVYVGANDGMLHAFSASDGGEVFAYVPSMVISNLPKLAAQPYVHQYFVDGFLTVEDAQFGSTWRSVLAGGLGAGGRGYFALDVTSASVSTETSAADKILWEFHSGSAGADNLGYGYSRPSIVKLNNDQWAVVVANGYLSSSGAASLYLLDVQTGAVIREIIVSDLDGNGLSSPTLIDTDNDRLVDVAYAGDLNGNLWKFDLSSTDSADWSVAYGGQPLFQTALNGSVRQPITTAPEVGRHPEGGVMVYVGTGQLLQVADGSDKSIQAVYGIWDGNWAQQNVPIDPALLVRQQIDSKVHASGKLTRVATAYTPNWSAQRGWVTPIRIVGATSLNQGERVLQDLLLRDGRVSFMSVNPTIPTGEQWFMQLDALTGGAPQKTIIDVNSDAVLDVQDNVDGDGDGAIDDAPADRVIGEYQSFGLASRPVAGVLGAGQDAALINHLQAISPVTLAPTFVLDPSDLGLQGGHFDVDTSHLTYPFDNGVTDGHVHQWDDKHNLTTINYFSLPDGNGNPLFEITNSGFGVPAGESFLLTIANDNLSPGGVLEINGASISVGEYRKLLDRYLSGNLFPGESFPLFTLDVPTPQQVAKGARQLTSLKMSFDAFAILKGDLVPTQTGCVKDNNPGAKGEYRNGALLVQALNASDVNAGFKYNAATQLYEAISASIHSPLGYATRGLLWESTVFWHWEGPCYGEPGWATLFDSCVTQGLGGCTKNSKKSGDGGDGSGGGDSGDGDDGDGDSDDDDDGDSDDGEGAEVEQIPEPVDLPSALRRDPGHNVTTTTIGGSDDSGRLFWRELVPEE